MPGAVDVDGVTIAYDDEGDGQPVLLLHGAPDSRHLWRHLAPALRDAGFRTVVPDLRGFGDSDRPGETSAYRLQIVLNDMLVLLRHVGVDHVHVVGHDWGGQVGWLLAALAARRVDQLVTISSAHPADLWDPPMEQRERFWYMLLARCEGAEDLFQRNDWKLFREITRNHGDTDRYVRDLSRPGALRANLDWYRANTGPPFELQPAPRLPLVQAPTLVISSPDDEVFLEGVIEASRHRVAGPWRQVSVPGASHWIPLDDPDAVSRAVLDFLDPSPPTRSRRPGRIARVPAR